MNDRTNTIFGWVLFSGIIALGLSAVSSRIFHANSSEAPETFGYPIEGVASGAAEESGPPLANLLAAGSAEAGQAVFAKCTACHTIAQGGANGIGPNLWAIIGQPIGKHVAGFAYSSALSGHGGDWSYENMDAWLKSPNGFASGTKMSFAGLSKPEDRANVILYLRENGGGPPLPEPVAEDAAPAEGEAAEGAEGAEGAIDAPVAEGAAAAGAVAADTPVADQGAAAANSGGAKVGGQ